MNERIKHMVIFCLKYENGASEAKQFLTDGKEILSGIPGVENFEVFNQISQKNDYEYGFSMEFSNQEAYEVYNRHPFHVNFVDQRWKKEVTRFLEIDLQIYE